MMSLHSERCELVVIIAVGRNALRGDKSTTEPLAHTCTPPGPEQESKVWPLTTVG